MKLSATDKRTYYESNSEKAKFQNPRNALPMTSIPCINCQELIPSNEINDHSKRCSQFIDKKSKIGSTMTLGQIESSLSRLIQTFEAFLERSIQDRTLVEDLAAEKAKRVQLCKKAIALANHVLDLNNQSELTNIRGVIDELNGLIQTAQTVPYLLIYLEKIKYFSRMKYEELQKADFQQLSDAGSQIEFIAYSETQRAYDEGIDLSNNVYNERVISPALPLIQIKNSHETQESVKSSRNINQSSRSKSVGLHTEDTEQQSARIPSKDSDYENFSIALPNIYQLQKESPHKQYFCLESTEENLTSQSDLKAVTSHHSKSQIGYSTPYKYEPLENILTTINDCKDNENESEQRILVKKALVFPSRLDIKRAYEMQDEDFEGHFENTNYTKKEMKHEDPNLGNLEVLQSYKHKLEERLLLRQQELDEIKELVKIYRNDTDALQRKSLGTISRRISDKRRAKTRNSSPNISDDFIKPQIVSATGSMSTLDGSANLKDPFVGSTRVRSPILHYNTVDERSNNIRRGTAHSISKSDETTSQKTAAKQQMPRDWSELDDLFCVNQQDAERFKETQRAFYSKCLTNKLKLESENPAQIIPISILFKEALTRELKYEEWDQFIKEAFRNPALYLDLNKTQSKKKTVIRNKLWEIANHQKVRPKSKKAYEKNIDVILE